MALRVKTLTGPKGLSEFKVVTHNCVISCNSHSSSFDLAVEELIGPNGYAPFDFWTQMFVV